VVKLALVCHSERKMLVLEFIGNNNQPAGIMLPPPALAYGRHPAHTDARGSGGAKTLPLQTGQDKAATINLLQKNDGK